MKNTKIQKMVLSAIMLALAFILSYIPFVQMPYGGKLTVFSMLPICFIAVKYGLKWGLGTAFCYSWLQVLQGGVFGWGLTPKMLIASLLLDYIIAFTVIGLAGLWRKIGKLGACLGTAFACFLRFLSHFLSGFILWTEMGSFVAFGAEWVEHPVLYSLVYNGAYMLPELILTVVGMILLVSLPQLAKLSKPVD